MFAKIFNQIYDSSIVESPETRFTFMDFLVLADRNGVVDMTHEAIARRTNRPIDIVRKTISELEGPDPRSRTSDANGARIVRLDDHRDWGWFIVNYDYFNKLISEQQRKEKTRLRVIRHRKLKEARTLQDVTQRNAVLRSCNASLDIGTDTGTSSSCTTSSSFLDDLKKDPFNAGVDIDRELQKARAWCKRKGRRCTERFFRNWVSRADRVVPDPPRKPKPEEPQAPELTEEDIQRRKAMLSQEMKQLRDKFKMP